MLTQLKVNQLTDYISCTIDLKLKLKNNNLGRKRAHALNRMLKEAKYLTNEIIGHQYRILDKLDKVLEKEKKELLKSFVSVAN